MVPLSKRLEGFGLILDQNIDASSLSEGGVRFSQSLRSNDIYLLLPKYSLITLEYNVLCSQLARNLKNPKDSNDIELKKQLLAAVQLARLLEQLYFYYLNVPHEAEKFHQDKECFHEWLVDQGYRFNRKQKLTRINSSASKIIREGTSQINWPRLLVIRIKRVLDAISAAAPSYKIYHGFVSVMDNILNPLFSWLAWVFYVPRLANNLFHTFKHVIPGTWMNKKEKELGWQRRLGIQIQRRWFELANDSVWLAVGVINCFILVGALATAGVYLSVALYAFDVALASLRACIELNRLKKLQGQYNQVFVFDNEDNDEARAYYELLDERIKFETMRLSLNIATTIALFLGMCFTLPLFAINPIVPLIAVSFIVAVCLVSFAGGKYIERFKPTDTIDRPVIKHSLPARVSRQSIFAAHKDSGPGDLPAKPFPAHLSRASSLSNLVDIDRKAERSVAWEKTVQVEMSTDPSQSSLITRVMQ